MCMAGRPPLRAQRRPWRATRSSPGRPWRRDQHIGERRGPRRRTATRRRSGRASRAIASERRVARRRRERRELDAERLPPAQLLGHGRVGSGTGAAGRRVRVSGVSVNWSWSACTAGSVGHAVDLTRPTITTTLVGARDHGAARRRLGRVVAGRHEQEAAARRCLSPVGRCRRSCSSRRRRTGARSSGRRCRARAAPAAPDAGPAAANMYSVSLLGVTNVVSGPSSSRA